MCTIHIYRDTKHTTHTSTYAYISSSTKYSFHPFNIQMFNGVNYDLFD